MTVFSFSETVPADMRRQWNRQNSGWRPALFACGVALLLALQTLLSPLASAAAARLQRGDAPAIAFDVSKFLCHSDAGDASGKGDRAHRDCCILCQSGARDAALLFAYVVAVATLDPPGEASIPHDPREPDVQPRENGWASSWSSRAPPFFS